MNAEIQGLAERFGTTGVTFDNEHGGLSRVNVSNQHCSGSMFLHGAHVCSYKPVAADEVFFMSRDSHFQHDKPIRGGVPICFPWFGAKQDDESAPSHGFARLSRWNLEEVRSGPENTCVVMALDLTPFDVRYEVDFGNSLQMSLQVANNSNETQLFEAALHSYFQLTDAKRIRIHGLEQSGFTDQLQAAEHPATGEPIRFNEETDRIYHDQTNTIELVDEASNRRITIERQGSASVIVWNPWTDKSKRMVDFGDDEWTSMCCLETANVRQNAIKLEPNESHKMVAIHRLAVD